MEHERDYNLVKLLEHEFPRYVGEQDFHFPKGYYTYDTLNNISRRVTQLLKGVHPEGKNIIVSDRNILSVMDSVFQARPRTSIQRMEEQVCAIIVNYIRDEFDTIESNHKLDIWVTKYDGTYGLQQTPKIKVNNKRPTFQFFSNY
jgi:hypothetical protein